MHHPFFLYFCFSSISTRAVFTQVIGDLTTAGIATYWEIATRGFQMSRQSDEDDGDISHPTSASQKQTDLDADGLSAALTAEEPESADRKEDVVGEPGKSRKSALGTNEGNQRNIEKLGKPMDFLEGELERLRILQNLNLSKLT